MSIRTDFSRLHESIEMYRNKKGNYPKSLLEVGLGSSYFDKSEYYIFDVTSVYKPSASPYTLYLRGFNRNDDGGMGDDIRYNPDSDMVTWGFQDLFKFRRYVYMSGIIYEMCNNFKEVPKIR